VAIISLSAASLKGSSEPAVQVEDASFPLVKKSCSATQMVPGGYSEMQLPDNFCPTTPMTAKALAIN
jgi:hypothetical protein